MKFVFTLLPSLLAVKDLIGAPAAAPAKPADLYAAAKIWTIHLKLTADELQSMEPKNGPGGFGRPGGPGGRGGPGGFGPAMFALPGFMRGDTDKDGKLSEKEFQSLGTEWFEAWDKEKIGKLTSEQLRTGVTAAFPMPGFPGMGEGPARGLGAPGGPGGPMGMFDTDFPYAHADLEFEGTTIKDVAVRYKGNSTYMQSRNSLKRSMKLDLNKYVKGQRIAGLAKLNLHSNVMDPGFMNEAIGYRLFRDAKIPAPRTAYARVYLTVPGKYEKQYLGLYSMVEEVNDEFAEAYFPEGGAIFKPEMSRPFGIPGDDWKHYEKAYDPKTKVSRMQRERLMAFVKFLNQSTDAEYAAGIASYLDLEEFARYMAVNVWLVNGDSLLQMGHNYYVYLHPQTNKFQVWPWDLDLAFGHFPMAPGGTAMNILHPWQGENRFLERVFQIDEFKKHYLARLAEFSKTILAPARITKQVDDLAVLLRPAVAAESEAKLASFNQAAAGETVSARPGPGSGGPPRGGFSGMGGGPMGPGGPMGGGSPIKAFVGPRAKSVTEQLSGKPPAPVTNAGGFRGGFNPGMLLAPALMTAMDTDKNGLLSRQEFSETITRWFESWGGRVDGALTQDQIRAGLNRDLPMPQGMPFGPPGAPPRP